MKRYVDLQTFKQAMENAVLASGAADSKGEVDLEEVSLITSKRLEYDARVQTGVITAAQFAFGESLVKRMASEGYLCSVHLNPLVPIAPTAKSVVIFVCPDIVCWRYGFVIEIDGSIHSSNNRKYEVDVVREHDWRAMGLEVFRIDNNWVYDAFRQVKINDILTFIERKHSDLDWLRKYKTLRSNLSKWKRKARQLKLQFGYKAKGPKRLIGSYPEVTIYYYASWCGMIWDLVQSPLPKKA